MRVILDTKLLLSALIRHGGVPELVLQAWLKDRFTLGAHDIQLMELRVASRRERVRTRIRRAEAGKLVNQPHDKAEFIDRLPSVHRSAEPLNDYLLALREAGRTDYLVTGDKAGPLALGTHGSTTILTARAFLDLLGR